jgi:hypothetical protein
MRCGRAPWSCDAHPAASRFERELLEDAADLRHLIGIGWRELVPSKQAKASLLQIGKSTRWI